MKGQSKQGQRRPTGPALARQLQCVRLISRCYRTCARTERRLGSSTTGNEYGRNTTRLARDLSSAVHGSRDQKLTVRERTQRTDTDGTGSQHIARRREPRWCKIWIDNIEDWAGLSTGHAYPSCSGEMISASSLAWTFDRQWRGSTSKLTNSIRQNKAKKHLAFSEHELTAVGTADDRLLRELR